MRVITLDGRRLTNEAAFWREYLDAVHPDGAEHFGLHLAAFRDAATAGGPGWPGEQCRVRVVDHAAAGVGLAFLNRVAEIAHEAPGFEFELA